MTNDVCVISVISIINKHYIKVNTICHFEIYACNIKPWKRTKATIEIILKRNKGNHLEWQWIVENNETSQHGDELEPVRSNKAAPRRCVSLRCRSKAFFMSPLVYCSVGNFPLLSSDRFINLKNGDSCGMKNRVMDWSKHISYEWMNEGDL